MVDPRIYRNVILIAAFAVLVFGFSLENQPSALTTTLTPTSFAPAFATMQSLARQFPDRAPGSPGDQGLANELSVQLAAGHAFTVSRAFFNAQTAAGPRTLETVTATRTGLDPGVVAVVAARDAAGSPATASLSGTAVLLQLARVLSGETQQRTLMLISTSGNGRCGRCRAGGPVVGR